MLTHEQLGARVDLLGERMRDVEERVERIEHNMATKDDIQTVLSAISQIKTEVAGPVEVFSTTRSIGKFVVWIGTAVAALFGAVAAVKGLWWK